MLQTDANHAISVPCAVVKGIAHPAVPPKRSLIALLTPSLNSDMNLVISSGNRNFHPAPGQGEL